MAFQFDTACACFLSPRPCLHGFQLNIGRCGYLTSNTWFTTIFIYIFCAWWTLSCRNFQIFARIVANYRSHSQNLDIWWKNNWRNTLDCHWTWQKRRLGAARWHPGHLCVLRQASAAGASRIGWTQAWTLSKGASSPPNQLDSAAGLAVAALAASVSETPGTISGEQLAVNFKWFHDKIEWFKSSQKKWLSIKFFLYSFQFLCTIFWPGGNFTSKDVFVNLFDSVRSKIN